MFATKIASRLVLEGAGYGRYDSGDLLPESPIIHTIVRPRASGRSFGTRLCSQRSLGSNRPRIERSVDASRREGPTGHRPRQTIGNGRLYRFCRYESVSRLAVPRDSVLPGPDRKTGRLGRRAEGISFQDETLPGGTRESDRWLSVELARRGTATSSRILDGFRPASRCRTPRSKELGRFEERRFRRQSGKRSLLRKAGTNECLSQHWHVAC